MAVPVLATTFGVVISLFLLQLLRRLLQGRNNQVASGIEGGLDFLLAG